MKQLKDDLILSKFVELINFPNRRSCRYSMHLVSTVCRYLCGMQELRYLREFDALPCTVMNHCLVVQVVDKTEG